MGTTEMACGIPTGYLEARTAKQCEEEAKNQGVTTYWDYLPIQAPWARTQVKPLSGCRKLRMYWINI